MWLPRTVLLLLPILLPAGCGKKAPQIVPVSGVVKINGHPASNIAVRFMPDGQKGTIGPSSIAITDENGRFTLQCDDGKPGGVVGWHRVTFDDIAVDRPPQGQRQKNPPRIDSKYGLPNHGLEIEVKATNDDFDLNINGIR